MEAMIKSKKKPLAFERNDLLKLFAIITMVIDHIGASLFPQHIILRIIGRIAFPIFCYFLVIGFHMTSDLKKYKLRMFLFFLISQIPYMLALGNFKPNIFLELLIGLQLLDAFHNKRYFEFGIIVFACWFIEANIINYGYGIYGIALIFLFYFYIDKKVLLWVSFTLVNVLFIYLGYISEVQFFSVCALFFISNKKFVLKFNKYFYYACYPLHLTIIVILKIVI